jgi:hypothetical protein
VLVEHGLIVGFGWSLFVLAVVLSLVVVWRSVELRLLLVGVIGALLHSQLEYPLWYSHLLLPVAFALGALAHHASATKLVYQDTPPKRSQPVRQVPIGISAYAFVFALVPLFAIYDYNKITPVYTPSAEPLPQRIIRAYDTVLFGHLVDYAAFGAIAVTADSAETHYRLGQRVMRFDSNTRTSFQMMMACGFTGRWDEASVIQRRLHAHDKFLLETKIQALSEEGRSVYRKIIETGSIKR